MPFLKSFAPGKKSFDFYIAQVSNKPERRRAVTFSASYYVVNQGSRPEVESDRQGPLTRRPEEYRLGASVGTTSYDYIVRYIKPGSSARTTPSTTSRR